MNTHFASALARMLVLVAGMSAALGALSQDEEEGPRLSARERRLGIPGAQAPVQATPAPPAAPSAPGSSVAVPAPAPPPPAQPTVPPPAAKALPAAPAVMPPPRPPIPSAPVDPARSDVPSGWPKVVVAGGIYSPNRAHRVVIINGAPAREGAEPVPGVLVEQVRADRVVLSYRGQRHTVIY